MVWHRNFKDWNTDDVAKTFGLSHTSVCALLSEWANSRHPVPDELSGWLENCRNELFRLQFAWNEQELMARFIGPLLTSIDFLGANYNLFHQRTLSIKFQARKTSGLVDGMVATGIFVPQHPFFLLQEYKKAKAMTATPLASCLWRWSPRSS